MRKFLKIGDVAEQLSVTTQSVRNWDRNGVLKPHHTNHNGVRFYTQEQVDNLLGVKSKEERYKVIGYCRVSDHYHTADLEQQVELMTTYLKYRYDDYEIIKDIGSGMNYINDGLRQLINRINNKEVDLIVILHKDILIRFGYELVDYFAEINDVQIKVIEENRD